MAVCTPVIYPRFFITLLRKIFYKKSGAIYNSMQRKVCLYADCNIVTYVAAALVPDTDSRRKTMKKRSEQRKMRISCAALILILLLTACGKGNAPSGGTGSADGAAKTPASASTGEAETPKPASAGQAEAETDSAPETPSAETGGVIYDDNDIQITLTDFTQEEGFSFLDFDITNKGSRTLSLELYPLVINNAISVSQGVFESVEPGSTIQTETYIETDFLNYAGISSIETVDGYILLKDPENRYEPIAEQVRIPILAGDGGDSAASAPVSHSDQVIYDTDGIRVSYLGSFQNALGEIKAVFFATNDTSDYVNIGTPYREESIDGKPVEDRYMKFEAAAIMPGDCALATASVLNKETYDPADFTTLDTEIIVSSNSQDRVPEQIPVHLKQEGDKMSVTADPPYVTEEAQESQKKRKEREAEKEAEAKHDEDLAANAEDAVGPEIAKTGVYNYTVGTSYNSAVVSALVHNPNERTALYNVKLACKAYGADDSLLDEPKLYYYDDFVILPGEDFPFVFDVNKLEVGTEVSYAEITVEGFDTVNTVDLEKTAGMKSLRIPSEDIHLNDLAVTEGVRKADPPQRRRSASMSGTLVNDGGDAERVWIVYTLYNKDQEIILAGNKLQSELAAGETQDFYGEFGPSIYELPEYDHIDIQCYETAREEE